MGCACKDKGRDQYEVISTEGKVLYSSTSKATADTVAQRYADSTVRLKPKAGAATT